MSSVSVREHVATPNGTALSKARPPLDDRHVAATVRRLTAEFSDLSFDVIASLVQVALARTADAKVQDYRVVLAERAVRAELRRRDACGRSRELGRRFGCESDERSRRPG